MDIAIVTGASSSLGLAISRRLIQLGFRVYGLGGDYKDCSLNNVNFRPMACDLSDPAAVEAACRRIVEAEKGVFLVVNNAKYFGQHAFMEMTTPEIERILRINLLCPLVIIRTLAASLKELQGYIIQLGAPYAETSRGGAAGAAASGGLKWMGDLLFHELRSHGVKVCHLSPEPNRGRDVPRKGRPGARPEAVIDPEAVAQAVEQILQSPFGNVVTEMILRPLRVEEPSHDPVREIPYPEPKPIPYTVPREMIEAEEQLEEEEYQKEQERKRNRRKAKKKAAQPAEAAPKPEAVQKAEKAGDEPKPEAAAAQARRRGRRKPRPPKVEVGFMEGREKKAEAPAPAASPEPGKPAGKKDKPPARKAAKKAARTTAKKAVKKAARKRPAKKVTSKGEKGKETA